LLALAPHHRGKMRELALFAGAGGGILGGILLGWRTVCAVEIDPFCRSILLARQRDGHLPRFPIWDDVRTFDGTPWRGTVDVVSGGFPCQDVSIAGNGSGIDGNRSGLWVEMVRIACEVGSPFIFMENSAALPARGLPRILGGLASVGYDCAAWGVIGAAAAGAPHKRERCWVLAYSGSGRYGPPQNAIQARGDGFINGGGWEVEPRMDRVAYGMAHRLDRLRALGNGQVPAVAALAWRTLIARLPQL